ncbi:DUF222 domain-containing protein [Agromyces sp. ZXT2-6]|uniref:DUF222 domain-containing protein n=1 Tax=Agromyces sp. ZXT2-6 TaxID=3461153 RepID=UPI004054CDD8
MPTAIAEPPAEPVAAAEVSAYALTQDGLGALVDAAVQARRIEAMQAAVRVEVINLAVDYAERSAVAFTSPAVSAGQRRELARRAVVAELATALRVPERTMQRWVSDAWELAHRLPAALSALRAGTIDEAHTRVIIDETTDLDDTTARSRLDRDLAFRAESTTAAGLRRIARRLREEVLAETLAERHARARAERRIELEPARNGMAWLHLHLSAADALVIHDRIHRIAGEASGRRHADPAPSSGRDHPGGPAIARVEDQESRTLDQLRADVARDLLLDGVPPVGDAFHVAAATIRPTVHVTVPVLTLLGENLPGELDGYGPIDADTARELAAHAPSFTRLLTHPVRSTVLDVDRTTYRPPADLSRWLQVRDQTCRFPGCARRAVRCDLDHTDDWAGGGRTAFDNLAHLCPAHHHLKHETSWSVAHLGDGTLEWRSPAGRRHLTEPAVRIPAVSTPAVQRPAVPSPAVPTPAAQRPAVPSPAVPSPAVPSPAAQRPAAPSPMAPTAVRAAQPRLARVSARSSDGSSSAASSGSAGSSTGPPF